MSTWPWAVRVTVLVHRHTHLTHHDHTLCSSRSEGQLSQLVQLLSRPVMRYIATRYIVIAMYMPACIYMSAFHNC